MLTFTLMFWFSYSVFGIVSINQGDATLLKNDLYYPLIGSTCFGLSPVHHQEHHLMKCTTHWYVRTNALYIS